MGFMSACIRRRNYTNSILELTVHLFSPTLCSKNMSKDFPFTTYDFYAYLASGLLFLFSVDLIYTGGLIFARPEGNFVQIAIVVAAGYISGQILAIPSSAV